MTTIAIFPESPGTQHTKFLAVSGDKLSVGQTAGEALDAMAAQLHPHDQGTLIVVQQMKPDRLFSQDQISRLQELMTKWRTLRDARQCLTPAESSELETLIEAELEAAMRRAQAHEKPEK